MNEIFSYPPSVSPLLDLNETSLGRGFYPPLSFPQYFRPTSLGGLELWLSTRYPETIITDGAASFASANSQYLSAPDNTTMQLGTGDFVICGWFKLVSTSGTYPLVMRGTSSSTNVQYRLWHWGGGLKWDIRSADNTTQTQANGPALTAGSWKFVFAGYDSVNNKSILYVDNTDYSISHTIGTRNSASVTGIGAYSNLSGGTFFLNGDIDSLSWWKMPSGGLAAHLETMRTALYNSGLGLTYSNLSESQKTDWGLVSFWNLDEATGTRRDSHGANHLTASTSSPTNTVGIQAGQAMGTGDAISFWRDMSGKNRNFFQGTGSARPTLNLSAIKDKENIRFDTVDDSLASLPIDRTVEGTLIEVVENGILVFKTQTNSGTTFFAGPYTGQQGLLEKVQFNRVLTQGEINQAVNSYRNIMPTDNFKNTTNLSSYWRNRTDITEFPWIDTRNVVTWTWTWDGCSKLKKFPKIDVSKGESFWRTWGSCGLEEFPEMNFSSITELTGAFTNCTKLKSFPMCQFKTTGIIGFQSAWYGCTSLVDFPPLNLISGNNFQYTWYNCSKLVDFPRVILGNPFSFREAWNNCIKLQNFPDKMFDNNTCKQYSSAFDNCALTMVSVDNILTSISYSAQQNNLTDGFLGIYNGTSSAPGQAGYYAKSHLVGKGWTVTNNGTDPTPDYSLTGDPGLGQNENWSVAYMKIPAAAKWAFSCI